MVTDSDRAFVWDDSVGRILDALVAVAHRAAEADVDTWRALGAWLERFVDRLRLDLAVDLENVAEDTAKLAARARRRRRGLRRAGGLRLSRARGRATGLRRRAPDRVGGAGAVGGATRRRRSRRGAGEAPGFSGAVFAGRACPQPPGPQSATDGGWPPRGMTMAVRPFL